MSVVLPVVAYVAGRYRDPRGAHYIRESIERARAVAVELWQRGIPTLAPHLNTALMDGAAPDDVWLAGDLLMLERCDLVMTVPGWEESRGASAEVAHAEARDIPVFHYPHDLNAALWFARTFRREEAVLLVEA